MNSKLRTSQIEALRYHFHSRHTFRCGPRRARLVRGQKSMTRAATRVRYNGQEATPEPSKTHRKRHSLIAKGSQSAASAIALQCAISIFLIASEFQFQRAGQKNPHAHKSSMGHPAKGRMADRHASNMPNKSFLIFSFPIWPYFSRHGGRNHTSLLRHALRSNPLTPLRTGAPIVAGMAPSARGAEACPRYR